MQHELIHGGELDRMQALFPQVSAPWIDLSTGINPWPYRASGISANIHYRLPTTTAYENCRLALATAINAPPESVCLAPGSELLIRMLPQWLGCARIAVLRPSYAEQCSAWQRKYCTVIKTANPLDHADEVDAIVVSNPNNPDGRLFRCDELKAAQKRLASHGGWLIVDEAYADLMPELSLVQAGGTRGLIVLRSFGKFYGLAGLRLGAIIAPPRLCDEVSAKLGAWSVSSAALEIGAQAYLDLDWQQETRRLLEHARRCLDKVLVSCYLKIVGGTDLFRLVCHEDAEATWHRLALAGIYVRKFTQIPHHLRIGLPANDAELERLKVALSP
ncbi:MAG: threonine-phosphate decarboxylase CobD [Gammaproteobacteria bacterium]|nr:threonine-phosphate decarboxylase CobD [Gammaproteobacteria bacterium]MCY4355896.1 threonine-phosphate decarboxylase CobD [Gammaproteobacteria bacterium]